MNLSFLKVCPDAAWQAALFLVTKNSRARYRTTIYLRPVNIATKAEQRSMPVIEAERIDLPGSKQFASLNFCSSYWKCSLDSESYATCGIIAPQGIFVSTRVLHGLKNASSYFQSTIPPLFDIMRYSMKAWIEDFTLHTHTELELVGHLENLLKFAKGITYIYQ